MNEKGCALITKPSDRNSKKDRQYCENYFVVHTNEVKE